MAVVTSLSRRTVLRGAAATAVALPLGAAALSGCSRAPSPEEVLAGRLVPLASAAKASAAAARRLKATDPRHAAVLDQIAAIRDEHEKLLREEVSRLHPESRHLIAEPSTAPTAYATAPSSAAPGSATAAPQSGQLDQFIAALDADAQSAQQVAVTATGFQAGLTASVAASITSLKGLLK
ncbi:MAG: hypothetical protein QM728_06215 [Gordonia sp. (in: high G+C Gram-positive bacteria)]|uniref:hypothetical protein n=1 Tax=Gordonia sp. (in: high G+C Gram-positive bacteria) TaxID=84139 RepID=UPI0039E655BE